MVAVDATTGKYKWHFQVIHHDLWDYDLPPAPGLVDIVKDGKKIPALAAIGNAGTSDVTMTAYAARTGALRFEGRYDSPAHGDDYGIGATIPRDGHEVCVLGQSYDRRHGGPWFSTIAFQASAPRPDASACASTAKPHSRTSA